MYVVDAIITEEDLNADADFEDNQIDKVYYCKKCGNQIIISDEDLVEFSVYDLDSVRIPAIQCRHTDDCPIGLLQIQGVWLSIDEVLTSGNDRPTGFQRVSTVGERVALSVLNSIVYKAFDRQPEDPEFIAHAFDEYAKLLWIDNTAAGFYTVKEKGTWCGSQAQALSWHLSVLDTVYISSAYRRQGHGLLAIHNFLEDFPDEDLGISEPVSESMMLVCKRFVKDNPLEAERLWLCTLPADNSHSENLLLRIALSGMSGKPKKRKNSDPKKFVNDAERAYSVDAVGSPGQAEIDNSEMEGCCEDAMAVANLLGNTGDLTDSYEGSSNLLRNFSVIAKANIGDKSVDTVRKVSCPILPMQTLLNMQEDDNETVHESLLPEVFKQEADGSNEPDQIDDMDVSAEQDKTAPELDDDYQNIQDALNCLPDMDNDGSQGTSHGTERSPSPTEYAPGADEGQYYVKAEPIDEDEEQHPALKQRNTFEEEPSSSSVVIKQEPLSNDETPPEHGGNDYLFTMQQGRPPFKSGSPFDGANDQPLNRVLEARIDAELTRNDDKNTRKLSLFEQMLLPSGPQEQGTSEEGTSILQNLNQSQGMISSLLRNIAEQLKEPRVEAAATDHEPIWQTRATQRTCEAQSTSDSEKKLRKTTYPIAKLSTHLMKRKHKFKDQNFKPRGFRQKDLRNIYIEGPSRRTRSHSTDRVGVRTSNWKRSASDDIQDMSSSGSMANQRTQKVNASISLDYRDPHSNTHRYSSNHPTTSGGCATINVHSLTTMSSLHTSSDFQAERPERPKRPFNIVQAMTVEGPSSTENNFPQGSLFESIIGSDNQQSFRRRTHAVANVASSSGLSSSHNAAAQNVMSSSSSLVGSRAATGSQNPLIRGLLEMKVPTKRNLVMQMKSAKKTASILEDASTSQDVGSTDNSRSSSTQTGQYVCELCDIIFTDSVMYVLHTGCHGRQDAYQCNQCGTICRDKYEFMIHFIQGVHIRE